MITLQAIREARERIGGIILQTPMLVDPSGTGLRFKAEHLQRTGAFKLRGAANAVTRAAEAGVRHVVTASSGNHGQAVAYVARHLGLQATIVVPEDCVAVKLRAMKEFGAEVLFGGLTSSDRMEKAAEITRQSGATFIPPYDHPDVIAGQGTVGLEVLEQAPDVRVIYVPVGGGGLISGIATAVKESNPAVRVVGVEPELANDTYLSRQAGTIVSVKGAPTIADGLRTTQPGDLTFPIIQRYVDEIMLVSEAEIKAAVQFMMERVKQVVEPSGAVSVAAALRSPAGAVAVISGGNRDLA